MIARAGQRDQPQVALEHDRLGFARDAREAEPARAQAFPHHPVAAQRRDPRNWRDERIEVARIGHGAAHDARVGDRMRAIAEGDRACFGEQADFSDLPAGEPLGQCRGGEDANLGVVAGAAQDEVDHRGIVDRRVGVGAGDKRGHAARGGGGAGAGNGLAMLGAGLAEKARMSTRPGETTSPLQSTTRASAGSWSRVTLAPTPAMTPSIAITPPRVSVSWTGSMRRALTKAIGGEAAWAAGDYRPAIASAREGH